MKRLKKYEHTLYASYIGYITQAIVNNLAPLLFLTFSREFGLTLDKIALITALNFGVQLTVDLLGAKFVDRIGYRPSIISAHVFAFLGLISMAILPYIFENGLIGLLISVVLYAVGGGIIEVLISPIVEACPTEKKEGAMSLLHSFYCWGHLAVILLSSLFFNLFGIENWSILACIWAVVPLFNVFYFSVVPLYPIVSEKEKMPLKNMLAQKTFWLFIIIMIAAGASEQAMSQWASAFAEKGLGISKSVSDLLGPSAFALLMGLSRAIYGKHSNMIPLKKMAVGSAILCALCYLLTALTKGSLLGLLGCALCGFSVGIFWPGTFSAAARALPRAGTAMYALMALAGDVGCGLGPSAVGVIANAGGGDLRTGLLVSALFPILILIGYLLMDKIAEKPEK